jgi:hypothetical protein
MSDEDRAISRRLRTDASRDRVLDGGAVAAGLLPSVFATFLAIVGPTPESVSLTVTTLSLLGGGVLAGYLSEVDVHAGVQGVAVVVCAAGLMLAVAVSTSFGEGSPLRVPLVFAYDVLSTPEFAVLAALVALAGALAGELGTRLRT